MKHLILFVLSMVLFFSSSPVLSADKVVVVPLSSSSAKGSDKQVQYNDNGRLAGSEMYYNKANQQFGVGTDVPSYLLHVKGAQTNYLFGVHNTSTSYLADGMVVRADGGDPFIVQTNGGTTAFAVDRYGITYMFGTTLATGDVAINNVFPSFTLTVNGTAGKPGGGTWSVYSDGRLKKNIGKLDSALDKITQLNGITYEWINPELHGGQTGRQAGFLAQEVEQVFPGWVESVDPAGEDRELLGEGEKAKTLYLPTGFHAYLVEAVKELKAENEALKELVCMDHPEASLCR